MNSETQTNSPSNFRRNLVIALGVLWVTLPPLMGFWLLGELGTVGDWLKSQPDFGLLIFVGIFGVGGPAGPMGAAARGAGGGVTARGRAGR